MFEHTTDNGPPCGSPVFVAYSSPFSITPAFRYFRIRFNAVLSFTCSLSIWINLSWFTLSKNCSIVTLHPDSPLFSPRPIYTILFPAYKISYLHLLIHLVVSVHEIRLPLGHLPGQYWIQCKSVANSLQKISMTLQRLVVSSNIQTSYYSVYLHQQLTENAWLFF